MIDTSELDRLDEWLQVRGAHPNLRAWVASELAGPDLGAPEDLAWEDCELLLETLLDLACESTVDARWLDAFEATSLRLGLPEDHADGLVCEIHGVTLRHLRSLAELGLSVGSTSNEIKVAHRDLARRWHPDRLAAGAEQERLAAEARLAKINAARRVLDRAEEVVLARPDDLWLDEPDWDPEDAPTEAYDDGLTELLEPA